MGTIRVRCTNPECFYHENSIPVPEGVEVISCPLCHMDMEKEAGVNWMTRLAGDDSLWHADAFTQFPSIITDKYRRLLDLCIENQPYGILLCLKDIFESTLKLEVLLAYAWAAVLSGKNELEGTIALITTPNLSFGSWVELGSTILKEAKKRGVRIPPEIPLEEIISFYRKKNIVNWRNTKIGHGAMEFTEEEDFQKDIIEKVRLIKELYVIIDQQIRNQCLAKEKQSASDDRLAVRLTGSSLFFSIDPYIVVRKKRDGSENLFFFDNQKTESVSHFQSYINGARFNEEIGYFMHLRRILDKGKIHLTSGADDPFLSMTESRELDLQQMSHAFVRPDYLIDWIRKAIGEHDRGILVLQMLRGMGKSVFCEKINRLYSKPVVIDDQLDVRTYHFGRTQIAGKEDFFTRVESLWRTDYHGIVWERMPHLSDLEARGSSPGHAFSRFLKDLRQFSARNRGCRKVMMVFDGLDEITDQDLWNYIPSSEDIPKGVYLLLTSRIPEVENLHESNSKQIRAIKADSIFVIEEKAPENVDFLMKYIERTKLKDIPRKVKEEFIEASEFKVLYLSLLCKIAEEKLLDVGLLSSDVIVHEYLHMLREKYGGMQLADMDALLVSLSVAEAYESLDMKELSSLLGESSITLKLVGLIRDLSPLISVDRSDGINKYSMANRDLAETILRNMDSAGESVRQTVCLAAGYIRDKVPFDSIPIKTTISHFVEIALDRLPEKLGVFAESFGEELDAFISILPQTEYCEKVFLYHVRKQNYLYKSHHYGESSLEAVIEYVNFAAAVQAMGSTERAIEMYLEVHKKWMEVLDEAPNIKLSASINLGAAYISSSRFQEAVDCLEKLNAELEDDQEVESAERILAINNLGMAYDHNAECEKALPLMEKAVSLCESLLGEQDNLYIVSLNNLALVLQHLERNEEALSVYNKAIELSRKNGKEDEDYAIVIANKARVLGKLGRGKNSLHWEQEAYRILCRTAGPVSEKALVLLKNIAERYHSLEEYGKALATIDEVIDKWISLSGRNHFQTATAMRLKARILIDMEHLDDALMVLKELRSIEVAICTEDDEEPVLTMLLLGEIMIFKLQIDDALSAFQKAYDMQKRLLGERHEQTLETKRLVEGLIARKRFLS